MRAWWVGVIAALALVAAVGIVGAALFGAGSPPPTDVTITIRYSAFEPTDITVPAGEPVRITLVNADPLDHEWIVGDAAVHERHRTGTESNHGAHPTEVSIGALSTVETVVTFDEPGTYLYVCHLPGHEAYGMVGELQAVER
jgi:uncharacterized cupredoxin-like copper-binding protein